MESSDPNVKAHGPLRAFLPLLIFFFLIALALAFLFHRSQARAAKIRFAVEVDGRPQGHYKALLNGLPYLSGDRSGVGTKTIRIETDEGEPFTTNLFVWYSGADLGTIKLPESKRTLALNISPTPNRVTVRGERFNQVIENCGTESLLVPVGRYEIESQFEHFRIRETATVTKSRLGSVTVRPAVGTLEVKADPPGAEFRLEGRTPFSISVTGSTPAVVPSLPQGEYRLQVWRGAYRKEMALTIDAEPTNSVIAKFEYAKVHFKTVPSGATIRRGSDVWGTTPTTISVIPGSYKVFVEKDGHLPKEVELTVEGQDEREVSLELVNKAFVEAMNRAQAALRRFNPDLDTAMKEVEAALSIHPDHSGARHLRGEIIFQQQLAQIRHFLGSQDAAAARRLLAPILEVRPNDDTVRNLKQELESLDQRLAARALEEKRMRPTRVFSDTLKGIQYADLFENQKMLLRKDAGAVRSGILRVLSTWSLNSNRDLDDGIVLIEAEHKGILSKKRAVFVVAASGIGSTEVHFKLLDYVLGGFNTKSEDSWRPLHPHYNPLSRESVEDLRARNLRVFRQQVENELKSP